MHYFEKAGEENTEKSIEIAFSEAEKMRIEVVVIASTRGETAKKALNYIQNNKNKRVIIVTHNTGFNKEDEQQFDSQTRELVENAGAKVLTGTMVLRGLGRALRNKMGYSQEEIAALSLRMISQGVKVCCEMAAMVQDAGLVSVNKDIICVAGTGWGADTVCLIKPDSSNNFFNIKVKKILAKPSDF